MRASGALLLAALVVAAASLVRARIGIGSTRRAPFAHRRGSPAAGVRYAFTTAFLPWAKESASGHLPSYLAGLVYHAGIFGMLASLVLSLAPLHPGRLLGGVLALLLAAALVAGLALLVKRWRDRTLRALSVPDDFVANLLVDAALAGGAAAALTPSALTAFQVAGAALLLYAPLGKLRHMLFLLTSRRLWGASYGWRGVLP